MPTLFEVTALSERANLIVSDVEALRRHYGFMILRWLERARARKADIRERNTLPITRDDMARMEEDLRAQG